MFLCVYINCGLYLLIAKKSLILESQQPDSLQKIRMLEDHSRHARPEEPEQMFEKPNFGRPLYNLDNLVEGQSAHLEATLTPVNDPSMKVEWFHNGKPIKQGEPSLIKVNFIKLCTTCIVLSSSSAFANKLILICLQTVFSFFANEFSFFINRI